MAFDYSYQMNALEAAKNYAADAIIILLALAFYSTNDYYVGFLLPQTQQALLYLAAAYLVLAMPFYMYFPFKSPHLSKGRIALAGLEKYIRCRQIEKPEKITILFIAVKFFYIPLMINFVFSNMDSVASTASGFAVQATLEATINSYLYPLALAVLFFIDTA